MVYIIILTYILVCVWFIDFRGIHRFRKLFWWILCVAFITLSGLRYKIGTDTLMYMIGWDVYPTLWEGNLWKNLQRMYLFYPEMSRYGIGWILFAVSVKSIFNNFNFLLICVAILFNISIFKTIKQYSTYPFLTILLFFYNFKFLEFEFEILRESLAVSVFLFFAFNAYVKKRWVKFYFFCILTILFHYSALFMLALPLVRNLRLSFWGYSLRLFIPSLILGLFGRFIVGDIINIYLGGSGYMGEYINRAFDKDYNFNYILQYAFQPCILFILLKVGWKHLENRMFTSIIFFSLVFMNFSLIYFTAVRLISYIIIIDCIAITPLFIDIIKKWRIVSLGIVMIMLSIFNLPMIITFLTNPMTSARYFPYQSILFPSQTKKQIQAEHERYFPTYD